MKANRKFLNGDDEAVSPVIAVILMVAITVVLAATVYVWVSGFSGGGTAAKTVSLTSNGPLSSTGHKNYTISAATQGLKWSDMKFTINGADYNQTVATTNGVLACPNAPEEDDRWLACAGSSTELTTGTVDAGNVIKLGGLASGDTLRILDTQANSVMLTLTIG